MSELNDIFRTADVVHFHCLWDMNLRPFAQVARRHNAPFVLSLHGLLNDWAIRYKFLRKYVYWRFAGRRLLDQAALVHCTSEGERRQALRWLPRDNARVVPLSLDTSAYQDLPGPGVIHKHFPQLASSDPKILVLGRLHPVKRIELLIEALALLRNGGLAAKLVVAGPCEMESYVAELRRQSTELKLQDSVYFVGTVDGTEKVSLYQACDVFVLPSWQENFGMVLAESLAAQTPIVTTKAVDTWSEFQEAGAKIVDPTPAAIAAGCRPLLEDCAAAAELGRRGRKFVFEWLDARKVIEGYVNLYRDAIANHASK